MSVSADGFTDASRELVLYIDNTQRLWKLKQDVWRELAKAKRLDNYDAATASAAFELVVVAGAQEYQLENKDADWKRDFADSDRVIAVSHYEEEFRNRWKTGELEYLIPEA